MVSLMGVLSFSFTTVRFVRTDYIFAVVMKKVEILWEILGFSDMKSVSHSSSSSSPSGCIFICSFDIKMKFFLEIFFFM